MFIAITLIILEFLFFQHTHKKTPSICSFSSCLVHWYEDVRPGAVVAIL